MIEISTKTVTGREKSPPAVERETLFTLDGVEHTIPVKFLPTQMLEYLHYVGVAGGDAAGNWALHKALGDTSYWALIEAGPAVKEEALRSMIDCVAGRMLGIATAIPGPKGEPDPAPAPETDSTEEPPDDAVWPDDTSAPTPQ